MRIGHFFLFNFIPKAAHLELIVEGFLSGFRGANSCGLEHVQKLSLRTDQHSVQRLHHLHGSAMPRWNINLKPKATPILQLPITELEMWQRRDNDYRS